MHARPCISTRGSGISGHTKQGWYVPLNPGRFTTIDIFLNKPGPSSQNLYLKSSSDVPCDNYSPLWRIGKSHQLYHLRNCLRLGNMRFTASARSLFRQTVHIASSFAIRRYYPKPSLRVDADVKLKEKVNIPKKIDSISSETILDIFRGGLDDLRTRPKQDAQLALLIEKVGNLELLLQLL